MAVLTCDNNLFIERQRGTDISTRPVGSHHPSLPHSVTPRSKPRRNFSTPWTVFMITGLDRTYHTLIILHVFLVSHFIFLFIPCDRLISCYPSAFYCRLNTHCCIGHVLHGPETVSIFVFHLLNWSNLLHNFLIKFQYV